jgi:hypothetical protein
LIQGRLQLNAQLSGDLTQALLIQGTGNLEVAQAKFNAIPALNKLGELLNLAPLTENEFESVRGSFKVENQKITCYELEAKSPNLSMTGTGSVGFDGKLDFDVLLIFSPEWAAQIPPAYQAQFGRRENGSRTITFKLSGTILEPTSNLPEKLNPANTAPPTEQGLQSPSAANPNF